MVNAPILLLMKGSTSASKMGKLHCAVDVSTNPMEGKVLEMVTKLDAVAEGVMVEMVVEVVEDHIQKSKISSQNP